MAEERIKERVEFIIETVDMLINIPSFREQLRLEGREQVGKMDAPPSVKEALLEQLHFDSDESVWILIYASILAQAAVKKGLPLHPLMDAVASAINFWYRADFMRKNGLSDDDEDPLEQYRS